MFHVFKRNVSNFNIDANTGSQHIKTFVSSTKFDLGCIIYVFTYITMKAECFM